jgi:predicted transcriptional regulator
LGVDDREAILLRYFERKTAKEIGERLGLTEEAAQKRATRALDRLRSIFAERGIATPTAGLATLLSLQAVQSAPLGLTASVIAAGAAETLTTSLTGLLMASTKLKIGLAAALAAAATLPLVIQYQTNNRLLGEITALKSQGTELSRLREELQRVSAESQLLAEQRERERTELARLRGELAAIKGRKNQTAGAPHGANPAQPAGQGDESKSGPLVPRDQWRNVGFQIPSATVQTLEWAKVGGDTNVVANALAWADANSRAGVEAIFAAAPESVRAKYGSADQYVLSLFDHSGPMDDRHNLLSYRILAESIDGDQAVLRLEYHYADGSTPVADQRYIRIGNEWRMALDFDAPSRGKMTSSLQSEGDSTPP